MQETDYKIPNAQSFGIDPGTRMFADTLLMVKPLFKNNEDTGIHSMDIPATDKGIHSMDIPTTDNGIHSMDIPTTDNGIYSMDIPTTDNIGIHTSVIWEVES